MDDDKLEEGVTFYQNAYYDMVFGALTDFKIPPKNNRNKDWRKRNTQELSKMIDDMVAKGFDIALPIKDKMLVVLSVTGEDKYLRTVDLDNLQKTIFDLLNEKVIEDDSLIYNVVASKDVMPYNGLLIGIKILGEDDELSKFVPPLYGGPV